MFISIYVPAEMNSPLPSTSSASQHDQHRGTSSSTSADYNMDIDQSSGDETNEPLTTRWVYETSTQGYIHFTLFIETTYLLYS